MHLKHSSTMFISVSCVMYCCKVFEVSATSTGWLYVYYAQVIGMIWLNKVWELSFSSDEIQQILDKSTNYYIN